MKFRHFALLAAAAVAAACGSSASADSILYNSLVVNNAHGTYTYNYQIQLTDNSILRSGDFFEIVDFAFLTGPATGVGQGVEATVVNGPSNWTFTTPMFTGSITAPGVGGNTVSVPDSATVPNLRWTYSGPDFVNNSGSSVILGGFFATSSVSQTVVGNLMAQDHSNSLGTARVNSDQILVPAVPSPAAAMGGMALLGMLGGSQVLRRRSMK